MKKIASLLFLEFSHAECKYLAVKCFIACQIYSDVNRYGDENITTR